MNAYHSRILELSKQHRSRLQPQHVVDDARPKDSVLHPLFEWDDSIAAEKYRIEQARAVIGAVRVEIDVHRSGDIVKVKVPAFVRDPDAESSIQGYIETQSARRNGDRAMRALAYEVSRAQAIMDRSRLMAVALGYQEDVDNISEALSALGEKISVG